MIVLDIADRAKFDRVARHIVLGKETRALGDKIPLWGGRVISSFGGCSTEPAGRDLRGWMAVYLERARSFVCETGAGNVLVPALVDRRDGFSRPVLKLEFAFVCLLLETKI